MPIIDLRHTAIHKKKQFEQQLAEITTEYNTNINALPGHLKNLKSLVIDHEITYYANAEDFSKAMEFFDFAHINNTRNKLDAFIKSYEKHFKSLYKGQIPAEYDLAEFYRASTDSIDKFSLEVGNRDYSVRFNLYKQIVGNILALRDKFYSNITKLEKNYLIELSSEFKANQSILCGKIAEQQKIIDLLSGKDEESNTKEEIHSINNTTDERAPLLKAFNTKYDNRIISFAPEEEKEPSKKYFEQVFNNIKNILWPSNCNKENKKDYSTLSDEILMTILSFMNEKDLAVFAKICSRFNNLSKDNNLWANIAKNNLPDLTAQIQTALSGNKDIKKLYRNQLFVNGKIKLKGTRIMPFKEKLSGKFGECEMAGATCSVLGLLLAFILVAVRLMQNYYPSPNGNNLPITAVYGAFSVLACCILTTLCAWSTKIARASTSNGFHSFFKTNESRFEHNQALIEKYGETFTSANRYLDDEKSKEIIDRFNKEFSPAP